MIAAHALQPVYAHRANAAGVVGHPFQGEHAPAVAAGRLHAPLDVGEQPAGELAARRSRHDANLEVHARLPPVRERGREQGGKTYAGLAGEPERLLQAPGRFALADVEILVLQRPDLSRKAVPRL